MTTTPKFTDEGAVLMAYQLEAESNRLSNWAQLVYALVEAFEANEATEHAGWALRPVAEGLQDMCDDCIKALRAARADSGEGVA